MQGNKAEELIQEMGINREECSLLNNIKKYEEHLKANIVVVSAPQQNSIVYPEKLNEAYTKLHYLCHIGSSTDQVGHFHCIKSITGLMNVRYFCHGCMSGYQNPGEHHCQATCMKCKSSKCVPTDDKKLCTDCGVEFVSQECYDRPIPFRNLYLRHSCRGNECKY